MTKHSVAALTRWTAEILASCGLSAQHAKVAADLLVRSDLRGYATHGLTRLPSYVQRLRAGDFNARPRLQHRSFPGGIVLDADGGMGHVVGPHAVRLAREALEGCASTLVAIQSCGHLGALGMHALLAAEQGLFCLVGQRTPPLLAMEGFQGAAIGHNPIAFACPVPSAPPVVFDIACSVAARGHILLAARDGKAIPAGWALDAEGRPTTDARQALAGALQPMGGHKGMGIAMLVECLAGVLAATAAALAPEANEVPPSGAMGSQGAFLWLVDPRRFVDDALFGAAMTQWISRYESGGGSAARLPGRRGARLEARAREDGMTLPPALVHELRALGERCALPLPTP